MCQSPGSSPTGRRSWTVMQWGRGILLNLHEGPQTCGIQTQEIDAFPVSQCKIWIKWRLFLIWLGIHSKAAKLGLQFSLYHYSLQPMEGTMPQTCHCKSICQTSPHGLSFPHNYGFKWKDMRALNPWRRQIISVVDTMTLRPIVVSLAISHDTAVQVETLSRFQWDRIWICDMYQ